MKKLSELINSYAQVGTVTWIGIRPERRARLVSLESVLVSATGLEGDHNNSGGKRSITLIQKEHLPVIASYMGKDEVRPEQIRRNIVVSGINLLSLKNRMLRIGDAEIEVTGICAPCSRMEETLGEGGYAAVRGHGGLTGKLLTPGQIKLGDIIQPID